MLEVCRVGKHVGQDDGWERAIAHRRVRTLPLAHSHVRSRSRLSENEVVVARKSDDPSQIEFLYHLKAFPVTRGGHDQARRKYTREFIARLLDDGQIRPDERTELEQVASDNDLSDGDISEIESHVLGRWRTAVSEVGVADADADAAALATWLASADGAVSAGAVHAARAVAELTSKAILGCVRNAGAATVGVVANNLGLDAPTTVCMLRPLEKNGDLKRLGSDQDQGEVNAVFQVVDQDSERRFERAVQAAGSDVEQHVAVPGWAIDLLELTNKLLVEAGQEDRGAAIRLIVERAAGEAPAGHVAAEPDETDEEVMGIGDDVRIPTRRLTPLLRRIGSHLDEISATPIVPFKVGRTRYLVNDAPQHENGAEMGYPIEATVGGRTLFFEANWPRAAGLFHIKRYLQDCGLVVDGEAAAAEPVRVEPTDESRKNGNGAPVDADDARGGRGLKFELNGKTHKAISVRVKDMLGRVLQILVEEGAIDDERLPVGSGRVRNLLAHAPYHRDETPFERAVEVGGYYIETAHAFAPAAEHAANLLNTFGATNVAEVDQRAQLAVRLDDGTHIEGRTVRQFVGSVMAVLDERSMLGPDALALPFQPSATARNFVSEDGCHPEKNGVARKMTSPLKVTSGERTLYAELNLARPLALKWVLELLAHVDCEVALSGADAVAANAAPDDYAEAPGDEASAPDLDPDDPPPPTGTMMAQ